MTFTMHSALASAPSRSRLLLQRCILALVAILGLRTWYIEGLVTPHQVTSGSMAETLLGLHREVVCENCGHRFVYDCDPRPVDSQTVCPNCDYLGDGLDLQGDLAGDRLLISKSIFHLRSARRWEVVAFRHPHQAGKIHVKRVVGLPGESIQIRHGDVYVDGQVERKTLPQQRALAVLVHDADFVPTLEPLTPPRWRGEREDSRWGFAGGRFAHPWIPDEKPSEDWLVYHHGGRRAGKGNEIDEGPITDVYGYNQTRPRREKEINRVTDLMLSLRLVEMYGRGQLMIKMGDGRDEFQVRIDPNRSRYKVLRNGRPVPGAADKSPLLADGVRLEVSLFDRQFLLAFDGQAVVTRAYEPSEQPSEPTSRPPLAIGSQGGLRVVICDLRVYRDVYYTRPTGWRGRWGLDQEYKLAEEEYFVLGDNSPVSEDSRTWPEGPAVPAKLLVGKPLVVHFPARRVKLGPWYFQVPDPGKIRYIR